MRLRPIFTAALLPALCATGAQASSEDAWVEFRVAVEQACTALVTAEGHEITVEVNPFGSEHYGAAVVSVAYEAGPERMICIYDKAAKTAELTGPFTE
ncbi:hypothetical protein [Phaeovulum sp. W22_SRMD_FR3]|uniref:hypothetical protein n=1 Tax=Phaeovulum sp. W22_SRMD_FR3 TaxID=3240274 RepID=UPI003F9DB7D9